MAATCDLPWHCAPRPPRPAAPPRPPAAAAAVPRPAVALNLFAGAAAAAVPPLLFSREPPVLFSRAPAVLLSRAAPDFALARLSAALVADFESDADGFEPPVSVLASAGPPAPLASVGTSTVSAVESPAGAGAATPFIPASSAFSTASRRARKSRPPPGLAPAGLTDDRPAAALAPAAAVPADVRPLSPLVALACFGGWTVGLVGTASFAAPSALAPATGSVELPAPCELAAAGCFAAGLLPGPAYPGSASNCSEGTLSGFGLGGLDSPTGPFEARLSLDTLFCAATGGAAVSEGPGAAAGTAGAAAAGAALSAAGADAGVLRPGIRSKASPGSDSISFSCASVSPGRCPGPALIPNPVSGFVSSPWKKVASSSLVFAVGGGIGGGNGIPRTRRRRHDPTGNPVPCAPTAAQTR